MAYKLLVKEIFICETIPLTFRQEEIIVLFVLKIQASWNLNYLNMLSLFQYEK
jgi:hypothetical protein